MSVNREDYAVVVGITGYFELPPLSSAAADAAAFAEWLLAPDGGGVPEENTRLIISPDVQPPSVTAARPVSQDIVDAFRDFGLLQRRRIGRRLYFYFNGHGFGPTFDEVGMLMADAAAARLDRNLGLRGYRVYFHDEAPFDEAVFILDCCRDPSQSSATFAPGLPPPMPRPVSPFQDFVIMAAPYGEEAFGPLNKATGQRTGLLTKAVLEGLKDPKTADGLGRFTAGSLSSYVKMRVPALATAANLKQEPELEEPHPEMVLGTVPAGELDKVTVRIIAADGLAGTLVLRDNKLLPLEQRPAGSVVESQPPWAVALVRSRWYALQLETDASALPQILNLKDVKGDSYVFHFSPAP